VHHISKRWLEESWRGATGNNPSAHRACGIYIEPIHNADGLVGYMTKSMPKQNEFSEGSGRCWGVVGATELYIEPKIISIPSRWMVQIRRILDNARLARARQIADPKRRTRAITYTRRRRFDWYGFSCTGDLAEVALLILFNYLM
jgi:hypothetical protein